MLWDTDDENGVIVNLRNLFVVYCGKIWYLVDSAKVMSKSARLIGRCGLYHFYLDDEGKGYCIHDWRRLE